MDGVVGGVEFLQDIFDLGGVFGGDGACEGGYFHSGVAKINDELIVEFAFMGGCEDGRGRGRGYIFHLLEFSLKCSPISPAAADGSS